MPRVGGRIQLVYVGKEDSFLTGNPSVSFFRFVYRRYTNFSMESIRMYFQGKPDFGQTFNCIIPRFGDLLGACFLVLDLPRIFTEDGKEIGYCNGIGHAIIEEVTFLMGETEIDKHSGMFENIYGNMTTSVDKRAGYQQMIGETYGNPSFSLLGPVRLHIPLTFWFNKNPGQYLPLLALQYQTLQIRIKLRSLQDLWYNTNLYLDKCTTRVKGSSATGDASITNCELWGDFIYLDNNERRRFVGQQHEYLIEQVQLVAPFAVPPNTNQTGISMVLNHPIKELIWVFRRNINEKRHEYFNFTSLGANEVGIKEDMMESAVLQIDGQDRFEAREARYFRNIQPYQYHTTNTSPLYIYVYSFGLRPEELQPSGTLNASRFYDLTLQCQMNVNGPPNVRDGLTCFAFAINYNILKIVEGYGGLLFAN